MKDRVPVKLKTIRRGSAFYFENPQGKHCPWAWCKLDYVRPNNLYKVVEIEGHPDVRYVSGDTLVYRY